MLANGTLCQITSSKDCFPAAMSMHSVAKLLRPFGAGDAWRSKLDDRLGTTMSLFLGR